MKAFLREDWSLWWEGPVKWVGFMMAVKNWMMRTLGESTEKMM